jgi:hypothetical protein
MIHDFKFKMGCDDEVVINIEIEPLMQKLYFPCSSLQKQEKSNETYLNLPFVLP